MFRINRTSGAGRWRTVFRIAISTAPLYILTISLPRRLRTTQASHPFRMMPGQGSSTGSPYPKQISCNCSISNSCKPAQISLRCRANSNCWPICQLCSLRIIYVHPGHLPNASRISRIDHRDIPIHLTEPRHICNLARRIYRILQWPLGRCLAIPLPNTAGQCHSWSDAAHGTA